MKNHWLDAKKYKEIKWIPVEIPSFITFSIVAPSPDFPPIQFPTIKLEPIDWSAIPPIKIEWGAPPTMTVTVTCPSPSLQ